MLKLTSVVMAFTLTSTNAMWVPEKRQEPEKLTSGKYIFIKRVNICI